MKILITVSGGCVSQVLTDEKFEGKIYLLDEDCDDGDRLFFLNVEENAAELNRLMKENENQTKE